MMEIRLKLTFLENLFLCLCLLTGLGQANGSAVVRVREGSDAVLPCFIRPEKNIERDHFEWRKVGQMVFLYKNGNHSNNGLPGQDEQFKGRVSHFPERLQFSDASIRIRDTKESDSGTYTCDFSPDESNRQIFTIELVVVCSFIRDRSEEIIPGASPQPHITLLEQSRYEAKLQCEVRRVSPKPKVKWQDSSGKILPAEEPQVTERGGSYDIILQTTVTKTDDYRCVVTQEEICHQVSAETSVFIPGFPTGPVVGGVVAAVLLLIVLLLLAWLLYKYKKDEASELFVTTFETKDGMLLQCFVQGAFPKPEVKWQDSSGKILPAEEPEVTERGGKYDIILNTTVTKTDRYRCVVTQEGINHQVSEEISVKIPGAEPSKGKVSELFVRTFKTKDRMLLQCEVQGAFPKPEVKWQDSSGKILPAEEPEVTERGGKYDIILSTTVTKTDRYRCVVTQEEINHQVSEEISVKIPGAEPSKDEASKLTAMIHKTKDGARLRCVVRGVSPKPKLEWQDSSGNILPAEELLVTEIEGKYDIILQTIVTKTGNYRCVVKQEGIEDQTKAETYVFIPGAWGGFKRWFCWWWRSFCNCCKKDSQMERNEDENSPESVELNRNHDTSAV